MTSDPTSVFRTASAGFLANQMARLFAQALAEALSPLGLAPAQFMTLLELWHRQGITQRDLVMKLDVEQATMASTLNRMERDGLIFRKPHPEDSRAQLIYPTPHAVGLKDAALSAARQVNAVALDGMADADKAALIALMHRVIQSLQGRERPQSRAK